MEYRGKLKDRKLRRKGNCLIRKQNNINEREHEKRKEWRINYKEAKLENNNGEWMLTKALCIFSDQYCYKYLPQ